MKNHLNSSKNELLQQLGCCCPELWKILGGSSNLQSARDNFFAFLNNLERSYYNVYSDDNFVGMHPIEKGNAKECIRVLKNIIRTENEVLTGFSSLEKLFLLTKKNNEVIVEEVSEGFLCEFIFLFSGMLGKFGLTTELFVLPTNESEASKLRSVKLDEYAAAIREQLKKYKSGIDPELVERQKHLKKKILQYFKADNTDWQDYKWQLKTLIKDSVTLFDLVALDSYEQEGVLLAEKYNIPIQITPYYLSLFNENGKDKNDAAIRAQVLPSIHYCSNVERNRIDNVDMDFMGERSTSPIKAVTRRYPQIVILKPYDSCPQICVYCQRNWEIKDISEASVNRRDVRTAIKWIRDNENISEVLVTGGDPLTLNNEYIDFLLSSLSEIPHIERIRLGTRTLATMPYRFNTALIGILKKYNKPGKREVCIITHFEHSTEITPDVIQAATKIRRAGMSIYNQQVFTFYNSLRFETSHLRKTLKLCGIDPYYTFNTKGKEETLDFRVPIARIEQERQEEARFLPGIVRTDEPVFNVPKLGKSHLRAWQSHEPVMIRASGERVYRFYPWEARATLTEDYLYTDVSIYNYLKRIELLGENPDEYKSIWYYF